MGASPRPLIALDSLRRFLYKHLRPTLLGLLRWTEKGPGTVRRGPGPAHWEVQVPVWVVGVASWLVLFLTLYLHLGPGWERALGTALLTGLLLFAFIYYARHDQPEILRDEEAAALLACLSLCALLGMEFWMDIAGGHPQISAFGFPLAAVSILASVLLSPRVGAVLTVFLAVLFGVLGDFSLENTLVMAFGGFAGSARGVTVRQRRDLSRTGLWVALSQGLTLVMIGLFLDWPWSTLLRHLSWAVGGGAMCSVIAVITLPFLETFFSRLTSIRLLELADVNHPLLQRLSLEAPGTYHHSQVMASLAEAAARAVGANALLCRVGALYHDVGKLVKPEYFVENQGALGNPHQPLPPNMSRLVIQAHVKEGESLARQYGLEDPILEFIRRHHGNLRVEYFYRRALEQTQHLDAMPDESYRYPGPRPFSKETAIVMLADGAEASVRALEEPTHTRIQDQVAKIIDQRLSDGQFNEAPLTLADLNTIADSFVTTLSGIYHARIRYPEGDTPTSHLA